MDPFVFIVGRGRSGTTLVRAMLASHSALAIPNETHFIVPLSRDGRLVDESGRPRVDALLARLRRQSGYRYMDLDHAQVERLFRTERPDTFPDAIRLLFREYARVQGKRQFGDKTPIHVLHIEHLARLFPEARFIHVIRDGRDVVLSSLDLSWGPSSVSEGAIYWKRFVRMGRQAGQRLGPHRYREIRYEDLLDDPELVVRALCRFVDLEFEAEMLKFFQNVEAIDGALDSHHSNLRRPLTKGLRDWRTQMNSSDLETFEILAGDVLSEMGYELRTVRPSVSARANATASAVDVFARRARRRVAKGVLRLRRGW